jgi:copper(I)-binding protein
VEAGKVLELKPGSYHVMLIDLKKPLSKGEIVPITLQVEGKDRKVEAVEVKAEVRELTARACAGHGTQALTRSCRQPGASCTRPPWGIRFPLS